MNLFSKEYLGQLSQILDLFPHEQFEQMIDCLLAAHAEGRRIFIMGNGGSAMTASHFACDLNKGCSLGQERRFKAICLNDSLPTLLAYANDLSYAQIFVEQLKNFYVPGDVVMGISASGNSANVLRAIEYANGHAGITIGWCGFDGGALGPMVRIPLVIRAQDMQKIEDLHLIMAHMTMQQINAAITGQPEKSHGLKKRAVPRRSLTNSSDHLDP